MTRTNYLVVATSGRALAQSARRAGLGAHVIDLFGDEDTRACAETVTALADPQALASPALVGIVDDLWARHRPAGLVPGSGFEACPDQLAAIARGRPLFGNSPEVLRRVKDPVQFFGLLDRLRVAYPPTRFTGTAHEAGWLAKRITGAGGAHIRRLAIGESAGPSCYLQRFMPGLSFSAVFLTDARQTRVLGYNRHWNAQWDDRAPFRHSGAVRWHAANEPWRARTEEVVRTVSAAAGLVGLCGMDFILDETGAVTLLEVNPRPPSTFELHEGQDSLFAAHLAACQGRVVRPALKDDAYVAAAAVLYAQETCTVSRGTVWPEGVADRPRAGRTIEAGEPVCTIHASAANMDDACRLVRERMEGIAGALWRETD